MAAEDEVFARRIKMYNGTIYCSIYKSDEVVETLAGKDFYQILQVLRKGSSCKQARDVSTGMLIEVPPVHNMWIGYDYGDFYLNRNGVLTL